MNFNDLENRIKELEEKLLDKKLISNFSEYQRISKEYSDLKEEYNIRLKLIEIEKQINDNQKLLISESDLEMINLIKKEIEKLNKEKNYLIEQLEGSKEKVNKIILEIRAGAGGEEAALFANDLFNMYSKYAQRKGWDINILNLNKTSINGIKEVVTEIEGKGVYDALKYESGVHRVQRIPETEKSGRIHTSTATVAVLPEMKNIEIEINPSDLQIDKFRSSGPGGQNVNKVETAIRITHKPTGIVVVSQSERFQQRNREKAMEILKAKLYKMKRKEEESKVINERRKQIGTADRAEKIRTYNFPQSRITDHRINISWHNLEDVLGGDLDKMIEDLKENLSNK